MLLDAILDWDVYIWITVIGAPITVITGILSLWDRYFPSNSKAIKRYKRKRKKIEAKLVDSKKEVKLLQEILGDLTRASEFDPDLGSVLRKARYALSQGNADMLKSLETHQLRRKSGNPADAAEMAKRYRELAELEEAQGNAHFAVDNLLTAAELMPSDPETWMVLGSLHIKLEQFLEAKNALARVIKLADSGHTVEPIKLAATYVNLGNVYQRRGELDLAVELFEKSLALNKGLGRKAGMAITYGNLGNVHQTRGDLDQAIKLYEKALALNTELGRKAGMASNYGDLGNVYLTRGKLNQATELYEKALALNTELGRKEGMASNYGNLGNVRQARGELDQATEQYKKALALYTELGRKAGMANAYGNLWVVHQICGELDQAVEMFENAVTLNRELGSKEGMAMGYDNLGQMIANIGDMDKAISLWRQAADLYAAIDSPNEEICRERIAQHEKPAIATGVSTEWTQ